MRALGLSAGTIKMVLGSAKRSWERVADNPASIDNRARREQAKMDLVPRLPTVFARACNGPEEEKFVRYRLPESII